MRFLKITIRTILTNCLILTALIGCNKVEVFDKASSLAYLAEEIEVEQGKGATSSVTTVEGPSPFTFSISTISGDNDGLDLDPDAITINSANGVISLSENNSLPIGEYILNIAVANAGGISVFHNAFKFIIYRSYEDQLAIDLEIIDSYLLDNNIIALSTPEGLRYVITSQGDGNFPSTGSNVTVNYTGKFLDGSVFDSNTNGNFSFSLGQGIVILGFDIGIALLSKGGKATLYLPSGLAYGRRGAGGSITPNEILIFEVELIDF